MKCLCGEEVELHPDYTKDLCPNCDLDLRQVESLRNTYEKLERIKMVVKEILERSTPHIHRIYPNQAHWDGTWIVSENNMRKLQEAYDWRK